eukprot:9490026-Pyramimonas_sp.AAC.1
MNQLNSEHVDAMQGENLASDEAPSKKQARAEALRKRQAGWSPKHRKVGLAQIRDPRGLPIVDPREGARALRDHWQQVFDEVEVLPEAVRAYLPFVQKTIPNPVVKMPYHEYIHLLEKLKDSAMGPDGLPYSVWFCGGRIFHEALYELYEALLA